jgi:hypothetical protein
MYAIRSDPHPPFTSAEIQEPVSRIDSLKIHYQDLLTALSPKRRVIEKLRAKWGRPGSKDGWLASRYFELTGNDSRRDYVDERTWVDLEYPKIFSCFDSTETPIGGQTLFSKLRECVDDPGGLKREFEAYEALRADRSLREEIQLRLMPLQADSTANVADYIFGDPPERPKYHRWLTAWSVFSLATLVVVLTLSLPVTLWLVVVAVNTIVIFRTTQYLHRDTEALRDCYQLLHVAEGLASIASSGALLPQFARLVQETPLRARAKRALRLFCISRGVVAQTLYLWLNLAFLAELLAYVRTIDRFVRVRPELASTFRSVGSLDAAIALASFLEHRPDHCQPFVSDAALIDIQDGYHPLLDKAVKNSIRLDGRSALVTGSNMAGKTTFIKTVGTNIVLGRTIGFCFASNAIIPSSSVMASIRGDHSIESGKSHYFAEIEAAHAFIETAKRGDCRVFVIDELFSGTNTIERLAAARAVLESLSTNAQVLVTTHDVELQDMLAEHYDLYHFREDPDVEGFFDYRLRSGATTTRNAIRLLERMEFPAEVVRTAMAYAKADSERDHRADD